MQYQLSIIVPSIRPHNLLKLYNSIEQSFHGTWEIIIVSPNDLPEDIKNKENIKHFFDFGCPTRAQQIGIVNSEGNWVSWAADDGFYLPNALDIAFVKLSEVNMDEKCLVMGKYYEGNNDGDMSMQEDEYYFLSKHDATRAIYVPKDYLMFNVGVLSKKILHEIGGLDCKFEALPMAFNDLAVRLQNYRVKFIIQQEMMFKCSHLPGHAGDHGPIHDAQIYHDQPLFRNIYDRPKGNGRTTIALNNWEDAPKKWGRRFK